MKYWEFLRVQLLKFTLMHRCTSSLHQSRRPVLAQSRILLVFTHMASCVHSQKAYQPYMAGHLWFLAVLCVDLAVGRYAS